MTRVTKYRVWYLFALVALALGSLALVRHFQWKPVTMIAVGGVMLIPGRIRNYLRRDFFQAGRRAAAGDIDGAEEKYLAFLERLRTQTWFKRWVGRCWGFQTHDMEAMTLNNLGGLALARGGLAEAAGYFAAAFAADPEFGLPYANLAIVRAAEDNRAEAERLVARARQTGYTALPWETVVERGRSLQSALRSAGIEEQDSARQIP